MNAIRDYLALIGAKGGKAGKGTEKRREICRRAAQARWAKEKKRAASEADTKAR